MVVRVTTEYKHCINCKWWHPVKHKVLPGECHRKNFPWPTTRSLGTCSDWEQNPDEVSDREIFKAKQHDKYGPFAFILILTGLLIVTYVESWQTALGVFIMIWGNNVDLSRKGKFNE